MLMTSRPAPLSASLKDCGTFEMVPEPHHPSALVLVNFTENDLALCYDAVDMCCAEHGCQMLEIFVHTMAEVVDQAVGMPRGLVVVCVIEQDCRERPALVERLFQELSSPNRTVAPLFDSTDPHDMLQKRCGHLFPTYLDSESDVNDYAIVFKAFLRFSNPAIFSEIGLHAVHAAYRPRPIIPRELGPPGLCGDGFTQACQ